MTEIINRNFDYSLNNYTSNKLNYWDLLFNIKFDPESMIINKEIIESFFENIQDEINDNKWKLNINDQYLLYKHYYNISESKFILRMESKEESIDFYYIGYKNKYIAYSNVNEIINLTTNSLLLQESPLRASISDQIWYCDDKIIIEYSHSPIISTQNANIFSIIKDLKQYFYFIYHPNKNILEVFNGNHWIFELKEKINEDMKDQFFTYSSMVKLSATSAYNNPFNHNDSITPSLAIEDIFNYQPGTLIYFASRNQMFAQRNDDVLIDVTFDRIFTDEDIYKPELCNFIKELGYDLSLNYDYITHTIYNNDEKNTYPRINYRSINHNFFNKKDDHVEISTRQSEKLDKLYEKVRYLDYNYEVITHYYNYELMLMLKHNDKCVLSSKYYSKLNKLDILYLNSDRYNNFIKIVPESLETEILKTIVNNDANIKKFEFVHNFSCLLGQFAPKQQIWLTSLKQLSLLYYKDIKQYNLFKCINDEPCDGITFSRNKSKEKKEFKPKEINLKINLEEKKIIMNDKNGLLVELDLETSNIVPLKIGYKYGFVMNDNNRLQVIIELDLPSDSKIVSGINKNRTNKCVVKRIYDPITNNNYNEAYGKFITDFQYHLDGYIYIHDFPDNSQVCCNGIHFCHSLLELQQQNW